MARAGGMRRPGGPTAPANQHWDWGSLEVARQLLDRAVGSGLVTRRGFLCRAATTAGAVAAATALSGPAMAQTGTPAQARVQGKLQVVQTADFHPDYNEHLKKTI